MTRKSSGEPRKKVGCLSPSNKDFGTLAVFAGRRHAGIVRLVGIPAKAQAGACLNALGRFEGELERGAIVTVEPGRIRIRLGPASTSDTNDSHPPA